MPKIYVDVPTKHQWKLDLGLKGTFFGHKKSPFPAMERLGRLIDEFDSVRNGLGARLVYHRYLLRSLMYRQGKFVVKNNNRHGAGYAQSKLGGQLNDQQIEAVQGLNNYLEGGLCEFLECQPNQLDQRLTEEFGKKVSEGGQHEDANAVAHNVMQWYQDDAARRLFKLSFRGGKAHKWNYEGHVGKGDLVIYDTQSAGDAIENGGSLYVMDQRGRIYVSGREGEQALKHSSFMAGAPTQCAGTMRVEHGQVKWVSGRSGHYRPTVTQMVNLLERLRAYQVSLNSVIVYRENYKKESTGTPFRFFEGCKATELLTQRSWPTGEEPQAMRVG